MIRPAAIYSRPSTADQNCQWQVAGLTEFAKRCGYDVVGVFEETASGASNRRKIRNQVIDLAQARKIEAILVTELSRWGAQHATCWERWKSCGLEGLRGRDARPDI